jgi:hypothetical protein
MSRRVTWFTVLGYSSESGFFKNVFGIDKKAAVLALDKWSV